MHFFKDYRVKRQVESSNYDEFEIAVEVCLAPSIVAILDIYTRSDY